MTEGFVAAITSTTPSWIRASRSESEPRDRPRTTPASQSRSRRPSPTSSTPYPVMFKPGSMPRMRFGDEELEIVNWKLSIENSVSY